MRWRKKDGELSIYFFHLASQVREVWVNNFPVFIPLCNSGPIWDWAQWKTALRSSRNICWSLGDSHGGPNDASLAFDIQTVISSCFPHPPPRVNVGQKRRWLHWRMEGSSSRSANVLRATKLPLCGPGERAVEGRGRGPREPHCFLYHVRVKWSAIYINN